VSRALFIYDTRKRREEIKSQLAQANAEMDFDFSTGGEGAVAALEQGDISVVVIDVATVDADQEAFAALVHRQFPDVAVVVRCNDAKTAQLHGVADSDHLYLARDCSTEDLLSALIEAEHVHLALQANPRALTNAEITGVLTEFFKREIMHSRIGFDDIPERMRPYLSKDLLKQAEHFRNDEGAPPFWTEDTAPGRWEDED